MREKASDVIFDRTFILGAGAIGSIIGALLSKKNNVTLVGNRTHMEAVESRGLSVSGDVDETFQLQVDTQIQEIPQKTLIFLTTKAYDSKSAMRGISKLLKEDTVVLVLQNGLGNEEVVKRVLRGKAKVLRGVTNIAAEFFKAGRVKYWKGETFIENDIASEEIADALNACGLKTILCTNIKDRIWGKVAVNSVVNPLTAIFRVRNHEILTQTLAPVRHQILNECVDVGKAEGIAFQEDFEKEIDREIAGYANFSSMYQDITKGNKTEIDFLNGKIIELGEKHRVLTPVNKTIVSFIKFLEEKNEPSRKN
jgi:2-dehydropantoate 2-reductase